MQSRLRTWTTLCRQWNVEPWPLDLYNIRAVAASLKAGAYKSAELYFDAAIWHQIHVRQEAVSPSLRRVLKDMVRSIKRGLPGTKVKAAFPFAALERIVEPLTFNQAYDAANPHHTVDLVIVAVWFMLREKELAAARLGDLDVQGDSLALSILLRKTAQGGQAAHGPRPDARFMRPSDTYAVYERPVSTSWTPPWRLPRTGAPAPAPTTSS